MPTNIVRDLDEGRRILADEIAASRALVVFTGAGISTESGIPDFRSPGGLWSRLRPIEFQDFVASEAARLEDWRRRFELGRQFGGAEPNEGHKAIARLVESGHCRAVITQNIDGLHARAGVPADRIVELHGNGTYAHCLRCGTRAGIAAVEAEIAETGTSPRCPACGGLVKCAVVSFGEAMPVDAMARAEEATRAADLFLAVGSSLQVYPAAGFPIMAKRLGARLVIVNRDETELDDLADRVLRLPIGPLFKTL
ncbi:SIR2 family NAD-dependent protein deacylase [Prosthecomicrobium sp. N25]|uniref:SIR2 family NAD-dependent protein deacylase n=1 Tax=Prosthecomicrobium sp. N25 TaxID=3129254 RepID=UPI00307841CF